MAEDIKFNMINVLSDANGLPITKGFYRKDYLDSLYFFEEEGIGSVGLAVNRPIWRIIMCQPPYERVNVGMQQAVDYTRLSMDEAKTYISSLRKRTAFIGGIIIDHFMK